MQRSSSDWYLVLIVSFITALCAGAVFYLQAWTNVDPQWFQNIALTGFGALLGLLTQKVVADAKPLPPLPAEPPPEAAAAERTVGNEKD
jgi:hypothetical protein